MRPTVWPRSTRRFTPSSATTPPKRLVSPPSSSSGMGRLGGPSGAAGGAQPELKSAEEPLRPEAHHDDHREAENQHPVPLEAAQQFGQRAEQQRADHRAPHP